MSPYLLAAGICIVAIVAVLVWLYLFGDPDAELMDGDEPSTLDVQSHLGD